MNIWIKTLVFASFLGAIQKCGFQKKAVAEAGPKLVWADEFNGAGLPDSTKWGYDVGAGCDQPCGCGWGNNELQFYTARRTENARMENGLLIVEAHREKMENRDFTSARLVSKFKGDWTFGRIEARLKCPVGRGTWPAFWMLPTDWKYGGWPRSGEIDIMEHVGFAPDSVFSSAHSLAETTHFFKYEQCTRGFFLPDAESKFHLYAIEWRADRLDFFVDDVKFHTFRNVQKSADEWPFDQRFHAIILPCGCVTCA